MKKILLALFISGLLFSCKENNSETSSETIVEEVKPEPFNLELANKKLDSLNTEISKLKSFYYVKNDEFKGIKWYMPNVEKGTYGNMIYSYFGEETNGTIYNPRLVIRYYGDSWIFWEKAIFLVDGEPFNFVPEKSPQHENSSSVWETSDDNLTEFFIDKIKSFKDAKEVKYRLQGKYSEDYKLPKKQINALYSMLELNNLMISKYNLELKIKENSK